MNINKILFITAFLFLSKLSNAQEAVIFTKKNVIYGEFLGRGLSFTANYDRIFTQKGRFKFGGRIGLAGWGSGSNARSYFSIPMGLNFLFGANKHHFEFGVGLTWFQETNWNGKNTYFSPNATIGYRLQKPDGGFFVNPTLNLILTSPLNEGFFFPYPGVGIGYSF